MRFIIILYITAYGLNCFGASYRFDTAVKLKDHISQMSQLLQRINARDKSSPRLIELQQLKELLIKLKLESDASDLESDASEDKATFYCPACWEQIPTALGISLPGAKTMVHYECLSREWESSRTLRGDVTSFGSSLAPEDEIPASKAHEYLRGRDLITWANALVEHSRHFKRCQIPDCREFATYTKPRGTSDWVWVCPDDHKSSMTQVEVFQAELLRPVRAGSVSPVSMLSAASSESLCETLSVDLCRELQASDPSLIFGACPSCKLIVSHGEGCEKLRCGRNKHRTCKDASSRKGCDRESVWSQWVVTFQDLMREAP